MDTALQIVDFDRMSPGGARVEFSGRRIRVILDARAYIDMDDSRIAGAGASGVWTKADSVTLFDDFRFGTTP